jgi:hypothetical protein
MGRVERLEKKEGEQKRSLFTVISLLISSMALVVSIVVNFLKSWGK